MTVKKAMDAQQKQWADKYERETGFDLLRIEDFEAGEISFYEMAKFNIDWYEGHVSGVHLSIQDDVPGDMDALIDAINGDHS